MTDPRRRRKHRSKSHGEKRSVFKSAEKFITRYLFGFLGIVFLFAGTLFLIRLMRPGQSLLSTLLSLFASGGKEEVGNLIYSFNGWKVMLQLLPGLLLLVLPFFMYSRYPAFARIFALAGTFWVFAVNIKVLSYDFITAATCYPTIWVAMAVTLGLCVLPLLHARRLKSASLQLLTVILFYISLLFIINNYQWHYYPDFLFLLLFSGLVILLCFKTGKLTPFYLQAFLSILLLVIFWIRRMVMRDSGDLASTYVIISTVFFMTFFISGLAIDLSRRNVIHELAVTLLMLVNTLFYWGSVLFVFQKYGYQEFQGLFTMILALFTGTVLYFSPKLNPNLFRNPYIFLMLFILSMIFPLWARQNYGILFTAVFSVLLVFYSMYSRNRSALPVSMGLVAIMMLMFFYKWVIFYFPGLYAGAFPSDRGLFYNGFQSGFFTLLALFLNYRLARKLETGLPGKWFSRKKYRSILNILFLVSLYISGFWCWHFLFSMIFPVHEAILLSWFSFAGLYLLILIPILVWQKSSLVIPVFLTAGLTLLAYPLLVNYSIVAIRNLGVEEGGIYTSCFIAHYFLLPIFLALTLMLYYYLREAWVKKRFMMRALQAFTIALVLALVLMEYDHLTVFSGAAGKADISQLVSKSHHLPWSVILLVFSVFLIGFAILRKHRFIRQLSVVMLLAALAKIVVFDFEILGETGRIILLFLLGGFLVAFSFFYPRFRKIIPEKKAGKPGDNLHR
jgi:hypothetical protein